MIAGSTCLKLKMKNIFCIYGVLLSAVGVLSDGAFLCYWGTWANSRSGLGAYGASDLPSDLCTHIMYSFFYVTAEGDVTYDATSVIDGKSNTFADAVALKEKNPDLKIMASVGGWSAGSENFSIVSNNETLRSIFVSNIVNLIEEIDFDGCDVDWEYPTQRGGAESDKDAFVYLLRDLKEALEPKGYQLTIAVGANRTHLEQSYNVTGINTYVDYVVMMTYDYHSSWDTVTGVHSPLYQQLTDPPTSEENSNASISMWIENGAYPSKLLLGIGSYGRSFTLESLDEVGTAAPVTGVGAAGLYSAEAGTLAWYEICLSQAENDWNITEVTGNYVYGNTGYYWIGYDNNNNMYAKGQYAKKTGLGGLAMWAIDLDDFGAYCSDEKYPLISAAISGYNCE